MNSSTTYSMVRALPAEHQQRLMRIAREVSFPQGVRLFEEGGHADRFWIIRTGTVSLDIHVPGRRPAVVETLGHNQLVGWSWLFAPHSWHLGAEATTPVRAYEFDAVAVRYMCRDDPALGYTVTQWVGEVLAHRLRSSRTRLLDLYAPYGSGSTL
ncbi:MULTISPECIES: cyclic nucleotide-binding domain-containing protein [unclassified Streptomyces]|uniref:Crp/Fnr family transcriptional regulator n=1 Tax=Streptomyces TaxID=1883 RepID=UPI00136F36D9|nr:MULTISPECIES: cyclic nucleotide-binding domain-containing protein [unclassified Streptomyces]NEA00683.1 cyclic nucleotide-binding domain-containing protein [Streptomyces sp. SID10116]MYY81515.1 cyclic nucleotide-binding domain-containing protein [Streptomyces sp. SID335]MYZ18223.1 cyclic nucleotide-binding domain-containing protein [Streptomyces sp. SID337]NDZ91656.1 cyclic nucleotide-binding domain-containing protein [Streptomyces sp. SID10115]NEB45830.1 cyclic nucleotide-binding domain-co